MQADGLPGARRANENGPLFRGVRRLTIRGSLLLGFGLVFAIWGVSSYAFLVRLGLLEQRTTDLTVSFSRSAQLLGSVRAEVLLGSVYLRDALLDVSPGAGEYYRRELEASRDRITSALASYRPVVESPEERRLFTSLQRDTSDYWDTALGVLGWDAYRRAAEAPAMLRERLIPKRQDIIRVSENVQALNRSALEQQQTEVVQIYRSMQRRVWITLIVALLVSIAVASLVLGYTGRLENRVQEQRLRDAENARDLQRLSARLVDVQEEERRTIARELHDEVGQALTAIKMELLVAERTLAGRDLGTLDQARAISDHTLQMVRDLSRLLHPTLLDDLGLAAALEAHLRDFARRTGVKTEFVQEGMEAPLSGHVAISAYRIVQEALTNVARHAHATRVHVSLQRLASTILLAVEDDGQGFDAGALRAPTGRRGLGLLSVQERVSGFRGAFHLDTASGKGTRITVELPAELEAESGDEGPANSPAGEGGEGDELAGTVKPAGRAARAATPSAG